MSVLLGGIKKVSSSELWDWFFSWGIKWESLKTNALEASEFCGGQQSRVCR